MKHFASPAFWQALESLPAGVRKSAERNFALLKSDPRHPSLHFEKTGRYWSVRIGLRHRALAVGDGVDLVWFWIGSHADYDRLLGS